MAETGKPARCRHVGKVKIVWRETPSHGWVRWCPTCGSLFASYKGLSGTVNPGEPRAEARATALLRGTGVAYIEKYAGPSPFETPPSKPPVDPPTPQAPPDLFSGRTAESPEPFGQRPPEAGRA